MRGGGGNYRSLVELQCITLDELIQAIIIMGLRGMSNADFMEGEVSPNVTKMENAVMFCWGHQVRQAFPNLMIAPKTRVKPSYSGRMSPTIDFTFSGGIGRIREGLENDMGEI